MISSMISTIMIRVNFQYCDKLTISANNHLLILNETKGDIPPASMRHSMFGSPDHKSVFLHAGCYDFEIQSDLPHCFELGGMLYKYDIGTSLNLQSLNSHQISFTGMDKDN